MNRSKVMSTPSSPPQAPSRPAADRTASPRKGESQAAAGKRARDMAREVARRAGAKPYDAG